MAVGSVGSNNPRIQPPKAEPRSKVSAGRNEASKAVAPKAKAANDAYAGKAKAGGSKFAGAKGKQLDVHMSDSDTAAIFWQGNGVDGKGKSGGYKGSSKAGSGKMDPGQVSKWDKAGGAKGKGGGVDLSKGALKEAYLKSGYSYDDAIQAKAVFDFVDSVKGAKAYIGLKILNGSEEILSEVGITPEPFDEHEEMSAYFRSDYTYGDAELAKGKFDFLDSVADAKSYIGLKVINGSEDILSEAGIYPSGAKAAGKGKGDYGYSNSGDLASNWEPAGGAKAKGYK